MPNLEHLKILWQGPDIWNEWRQKHPNMIPDLAGAIIGVPRHVKYAPLWSVKLRGIDLRKANLVGACLRGVDLDEADISFANLTRADLWKSVLREAKAENTQFRGADLSEANLYGANMNGAYLIFAKLHRTTLSSTKLLSARFCGADLRGAQLDGASMSFSDLRLCNLEGANLNRADLHQAKLSDSNLTGATLKNADLSFATMSGACLCEAVLHHANLLSTDIKYGDLREADLRGCSLIRTDLREAILEGCKVYGISAWDVLAEGTIQSALVLGNDEGPRITVGDIEVAQFIYLLIKNKKIRHVIDSITSKVVLILGRFKRMDVLTAMWDKLLERDYIPVLFSFDKPSSQDYIETVSTLAHMSRFVVADMTDPKIVLEEVPHIVRNIAVPVKPLLASPEPEPTTLYNLRKNHKSIMDTYTYVTVQELLDNFDEQVVFPAEAKRKELLQN